MNNKIKELAIKCGMEDYPTYGVNALYGEQDIEKFANAIIDECMMAVHDKAFEQNVSNVFLWVNDIVVTHFED